jgi:hypothetical protein
MADMEVEAVPGQNLADRHTERLVTMRHQNAGSLHDRGIGRHLNLENLLTAAAAQGDPFTSEALAVKAKSGRTRRTTGNHQNLSTTLYVC